MFYNTKVTDLDLYGKNESKEFANEGLDNCNRFLKLQSPPDPEFHDRANGRTE